MNEKTKCGVMTTKRVCWPGDLPSPQCDKHMAGVLRLAEAIGCPCPVQEDQPEEPCCQSVEIEATQ